MSCEEILQLGINRKNASCVTLWCRCSSGRWSRRPLCRSPNCWNIGGGHEDEDIKHDHDRITIYLSNLFNTGQFCKTWYYVLILLWSDSVNMPSVIKCNECEKSSPQKFPWGRAGQKVQVTEISPHPSPRARTLYFVGSVVLVIVKSWKMHFLLFTLPLSFPCVHHIKTFFTIFHCIVYKHWFWMMCRSVL